MLRSISNMFSPIPQNLSTARLTRNSQILVLPRGEDFPKPPAPPANPALQIPRAASPFSSQRIHSHSFPSLYPEHAPFNIHSFKIPVYTNSTSSSFPLTHPNCFHICILSQSFHQCPINPVSSSITKLPAPDHLPLFPVGSIPLCASPICEPVASYLSETRFSAPPGRLALTNREAFIGEWWKWGRDWRGWVHP